MKSSHQRRSLTEEDGSAQDILGVASNLSDEEKMKLIQQLQQQLTLNQPPTLASPIPSPPSSLVNSAKHKDLHNSSSNMPTSSSSSSLTSPKTRAHAANNAQLERGSSAVSLTNSLSSNSSESAASSNPASLMGSLNGAQLNSFYSKRSSSGMLHPGLVNSSGSQVSDCQYSQENSDGEDESAEASFDDIDITISPHSSLKRKQSRFLLQAVAAASHPSLSPLPEESSSLSNSTTSSSHQRDRSSLDVSGPSHRHEGEPVVPGGHSWHSFSEEERKGGEWSGRKESGTPSRPQSSSTSSASVAGAVTYSGSSQWFTPRRRILEPLRSPEEQRISALWRESDNGEELEPLFQYLQEKFRCSILDLNVLKLENDLDSSPSIMEWYVQIRKLLHSMDWSLRKPIAQCIYGSVFRAIEKIDPNDPVPPQDACVKVIDLSGVNIQGNKSALTIEQDISNWISMNERYATPNLLTVYSSNLHCHMDVSQLWVASEWMEHGSFSDIMTKRKKSAASSAAAPTPASSPLMPETLISLVLGSCLLGLQQLYSLLPPGREGKSVAHGAIKLSNILLNATGQIKLSDRAIQQQLEATFKPSNMDQVFISPPEMISQNTYDERLGDIWQIGLVAIELCDGRLPHAGIHPLKVCQLIPRSPAPTSAVASAQLKDFIAKCCVKEPTEVRHSSERSYSVW